MQEVCNSLADTGSSIWLPIVGGVLCVVIAAVCLLYARRHGKRLTYPGFGILLVVLLGLVAANARPAHAASTCNTTTNSASSTPVTPSQPGTLELVDNTIQSSDLNLQTEEFSFWSGTFDILANDHAPAGDPIDPNTVRLSGLSEQLDDSGQRYGSLPAGISFDVYAPGDTPGDDAPIGYIGLDGVQWGDYDPITDTFAPNDYSNLTGKIIVESYSELPADTTVTIQYTAKTMSGKDASNTAVITITLPPLPTPPPPPTPPQLVDDDYTLGNSGGAILSVLDNDQPDANDPLDTSTLELLNPNAEGGGYGTNYYTAPDGSPSYGGDSTAIHWQVVGGKVVVTFGDDTPLDTPFSIPYHITSQGGLESEQDGVITVTRSSTQISPIQLTVSNFSGGGGCTLSGETANLLDFVSTNNGTLDPSTIDLDPTTPGRQTSYSYDAGDTTVTVTVDGSGVVTITNSEGLGYVHDHVFYFTIANTAGDVSGIGVVVSTENCG